MTSTLTQRAHALLDGLPEPASPEACWERAALESVASERPGAPDTARLRALTQPSVAWTNLPSWPREHLQARLAAMFATGHWAIGERDLLWLQQLDRAWLALPDEFLDQTTVLRARGELGLALGARGTRPFGWDADELQWLREDQGFARSSPADEAWQALALGERTRAAQAVDALEQRLAHARRAWSADEDAALRQIRVHPAAALGVEPRALRTLLETSDRGG